MLVKTGAFKETVTIAIASHPSKSFLDRVVVVVVVLISYKKESMVDRNGNYNPNRNLVQERVWEYCVDDDDDRAWAVQLPLDNNK